MKQKFVNWVLEHFGQLIIGGIVVIIAIIAIVSGFTCNKGSSSSKNKCGSCGKKVSAGETDYKYVSNTNMCKSCYLSYCRNTGRKPHNYGDALFDYYFIV